MSLLGARPLPFLFPFLVHPPLSPRMRYPGSPPVKALGAEGLPGICLSLAGDLSKALVSLSVKGGSLLAGGRGGSSLRIEVGHLRPPTPLQVLPQMEAQVMMLGHKGGVPSIPAPRPVSCRWPGLTGEAARCPEPLPRDLRLCPRAAPPLPLTLPLPQTLTVVPTSLSSSPHSAVTAPSSVFPFGEWSS